MQSRFSEKIAEMSFTEELAIQALSQICQLGLEPTPEIYSLWYSYFKEDDCDLRKRMDYILEQYDVVHSHHFEVVLSSFKRKNFALVDFQESISTSIEDTFNNAEDISENLDELVDFIMKTSKAEDKEPLEIIDDIVDKSNNAISINKTLTLKLIEQKKHVETLQVEYERVCDEIITDGLTKLRNRRYLDEKLPKMLRDAIQNNELLSVLIFDIDHFKKFNDEHGHLVGDTVLRFVGQTMKTMFKDNNDNLFRYGGEEFVVLFPSVGKNTAEKYAKQLANKISKKEITLRSSKEVLGNVTISGGVTENIKRDTVQSILERADMALYESKSNGRNRMTVARI